MTSRPPIPDQPPAFFIRCDGGHCADLAVSWAYDEDSGWIAVCADHAEES